MDHNDAAQQAAAARVRKQFEAGLNYNDRWESKPPKFPPPQQCKHYPAAEPATEE